MEPRLNFYKAGPDATKVVAGLEQQTARSGLEKPLVELVRLRASQINGCAHRLDLQTIDARAQLGNEARRADRGRRHPHRASDRRREAPRQLSR
jgi:AhpD family alkylhydroperoxidase